MGFSPYPWSAPLNDIPAAAALVRRAAKRADVVIVLMHAGAEGADQIHTPYGTQYFLGEDRGNVRAFAHAMVNAGADLVLGSGPHVIRGIERYRTGSSPTRWATSPAGATSPSAATSASPVC